MGDGFPGVWGEGNIVNFAMRMQEQSTNNQETRKPKKYRNMVELQRSKAKSFEKNIRTCYSPLLSWVCVHLFAFTVAVALPLWQSIIIYAPSME